ncbi:MAG: MerR family transcriptional regulator [Deltaproteobacteria bacterium]|nr:MerR family transcriptional regulator [Deltaproteobacteria bacterium]
MEKLLIGQLAKKACVNTETIRFYERRGLLAKPLRNKSGHRQYTLNDVVRVRFIKRAQALGFSLKEIEDLLSIRMKSGATCGDVKNRVEDKISAVKEKIKALKQINAALKNMSQQCMINSPIGNCSFLESLEAQSAKEAQNGNHKK